MLHRDCPLVPFKGAGYQSPEEHPSAHRPIGAPRGWRSGHRCSARTVAWPAYCLTATRATPSLSSSSFSLSTWAVSMGAASI